jgi:hypothetical protein
LRTTQLRAADGTVWHVRNGEIDRVGNFSRDRRRVLLDEAVERAGIPLPSAAEAAVARPTAGADEHAPSWWVLADAEGNEACVATWMDRD